MYICRVVRFILTTVCVWEGVVFSVDTIIMYQMTKIHENKIVILSPQGTHLSWVQLTVYIIYSPLELTGDGAQEIYYYFPWWGQNVCLYQHLLVFFLMGSSASEKNKGVYSLFIMQWRSTCIDFVVIFVCQTCPLYIIIYWSWAIVLKCTLIKVSIV